MAIFDKRTAQVLVTFLLFAALLGFVYLAIKPLLIFLFAMLFAYLLEPATSRVERWTHSRPAAIAVVYVAWISLLGIAGFLIGSRVVGEGHKLIQITARSLPEDQQRAILPGSSAPEQAGVWRHNPSSRISSPSIANRQSP